MRQAEVTGGGKARRVSESKEAAGREGTGINALTWLIPGRLGILFWGLQSNGQKAGKNKPLPAGR